MELTKRLTICMAIAACVLLGATAALAQDDLGMDDAMVSGDVNSTCALVVQDFFRTRDMSVLGPNVTFSDPDTMDAVGTMDMPPSGADTTAEGETTGEGIDTTDSMGSMLQPMLFDMAAFGDGSYDIRSMIVGDNAVVVEFTFSGTNTGDLMGQAATNAMVNTPAVAIFACQGDVVSDVRVYYDRVGIMNQLGMGTSMTGEDTMAGADTTAMDDMETAGNDTLAGMDTVASDSMTGEDAAALDTMVGMDTLPPDPYALLDAISDDPAAYMGQTVTVAGPIREIVGGDLGNGFIIVEEDLIGDDPALILGTNPELLSGGAWAIDQQVIVTGVVHGMVVADLEAQLGYDLSDDLYVAYEGVPVIIASEVGPYDPNAQ